MSDAGQAPDNAELSTLNAELRMTRPRRILIFTQEETEGAEFPMRSHSAFSATSGEKHGLAIFVSISVHSWFRNLGGFVA